MEMKDIKQLLEDILNRLGYSIVYTRGEAGVSGFYTLGKKKEVIIDTDRTDGEIVDVLLSALRKTDTSSLYLPPVIRDLLDKSEATDTNS